MFIVVLIHYLSVFSSDIYYSVLGIQQIEAHYLPTKEFSVKKHSIQMLSKLVFLI